MVKKAYHAKGRKIRCEYCNSPKVVRETGFAIVQQESPETGESIVNESLFFSTDPCPAARNSIEKI